MRVLRSLALGLGVSVFGLNLAITSVHCGEGTEATAHAARPAADVTLAAHGAHGAHPATAADHAVDDVRVADSPPDGSPPSAPPSAPPECCLALGSCSSSSFDAATLHLLGGRVATSLVAPATFALPVALGTPPDPPPPRG